MEVLNFQPMITCFIALSNDIVLQKIQNTYLLVINVKVVIKNKSCESYILFHEIIVRFQMIMILNKIYKYGGGTVFCHLRVLVFNEIIKILKSIIKYYFKTNF